MPEETHRHLIEFVQTGADQVVTATDRIAESQRRLAQAQQIDIPERGVSAREVLRREIERMQQPLQEQQRLLTGEVDLRYRVADAADREAASIRRLAAERQAAQQIRQGWSIAERGVVDLPPVEAARGGILPLANITPEIRQQIEAAIGAAPPQSIAGMMGIPVAAPETQRAFREAEAIARRQAIPPEERVRAEAQARGLDPAAETAAVERLNELRAARIPIERAIKQAINEVESALVKEEAAARKAEAARRETVATQRALQESYRQTGLRPIEEKELPFVEKMEARGIPLENQVKVLDEMKNVMSSSLGPQEAFATAQRNVKRSLDESGEAAKTSGNWLGRYIQRYLVRYLVVWQGMRALQSTMRAWVVAHDEMDRALFRVQTTMGLSISQAERYMATMRRMGGEVGLPAAQMAGGAMQMGPTAGMAGQFGAMAGMGGAEGMKFFAGIQKQYDLSAEELEELIPRIWAAFAGSGEDIQTFLGHWQDLVNDLDSGSDAVAKWTRDWATYETTSMRATDKVKTAWGDFLTVLGDTQPIIDAKEAIASWFDRLTGKILYTQLAPGEKSEAERRYEAETGRQAEAGGGLGQFWAWGARGGFEGAPETTRPAQGVATAAEGRLTIRPSEIGAGVGTQFIDSVQVMTQAQYDQLEAITNQKEEMLTAQGIISSELKEQVAIQTEHGYKFDEINTTMLAMLLATEEIKDMQRQQMTGYFNWPGAQPSVMIGRPGQAEFPGREERPPDPNINITQPEPSPWIPWISGGPPYYQEGGPVTETGPAIVDQGEYIFTQEQVSRLGLPMLERLARSQPADMPQPADRLQESMLMQMVNVPRYQYGGVVPGQGPQPAIVEGGEIIQPRGQAAVGSLKVQSDLYLDGERVSRSVMKFAGDQLLQAQRASTGATGALLSI